jgi:ferrous iron transport protein B
VLVFLPNIMIMFMMVALMEDSGYMARAAFIVDKLMHLVGLHGKSFIPLFVGFGCNVPGIMAARVLENKRDRVTTILVTPFMSCSARLPVYVLLAGAFFSPERAGTVVFSMYLLGTVVAMVMAKALRAFVVKGPPTPFVMELPPYRLPTAKGILIHMWERARMYLRKAGTIILFFSLVTWVLSSYPRSDHYSPEVSADLAAESALLAAAGVGGAAREEHLSSGLRQRMEKERLEASFAGRYGRALAPALAPIGLSDWRVGVALTMGFAAKEIVVSTFGTLFSLGSGDEVAEEAGALGERLRQDPFFNPLRAYTLMVFVLLYVPCLATVAVAFRELGSWKWAVFLVLNTISVAYLAAGTVYWGGMLLGLGLR